MDGYLWRYLFGKTAHSPPIVSDEKMHCFDCIFL